MRINSLDHKLYSNNAFDIYRKLPVRFLLSSCLPTFNQNDDMYGIYEFKDIQIIKEMLKEINIYL